MRRGFTLIEMIVTIVILGILSAGTFVSLQHLYIRSAKSKALSDLSAESQVIVDQIASLMYDRVPSSVIGYDGSNNFESIYELSNTSFRVLEWIGVASEAHKVGAYSGFVDMNASSKPTLNTIDINKTRLGNIMDQKFKDGNISKVGLMFAGSFDDSSVNSDFNNTYGWHDANTTAIKISDFDGTDNNDVNITLTKNIPDEIYEKYYLLDSAYTVALGRDVNTDLNCFNSDVNTSSLDYNNTLLLFYNYRPWNRETFCGDKGDKGNRDGNVTILSKNVSGFEAGVINGSIYFNVAMNKVIRGSDNNVTISKQKAVY